jgi:hypothetical protein
VTSTHARPTDFAYSPAEVLLEGHTSQAKAPLTKAARQAKITDLITRGAVHSQSELADQLISRGLSVTQATLSRDLAELGAFKVRGAAGLVYALPASAPSNGAAASGAAIGPLLVRRLAELLISAEAAPLLATTPSCWSAGRKQKVKAPQIRWRLAWQPAYWQSPSAPTDPDSRIQSTQVPLMSHFCVKQKGVSS